MTLNGVWCAYQDGWYADNSIIIYDEILHNSTNMNDHAEIGLDLQSGKK